MSLTIHISPVYATTTTSL